MGFGNFRRKYLQAPRQKGNKAKSHLQAYFSPAFLLPHPFQVTKLFYIIKLVPNFHTYKIKSNQKKRLYRYISLQ